MNVDEYYNSIRPFRLGIGRPSRESIVPVTNLTIVLDLDETLVRSEEGTSIKLLTRYLTENKYYNRRRDMYHFVMRDNKTSREIYGIKRPFVDNFLDFAFTYFKRVIVWSAGQYEYVHNICNILFGDNYQPDLIFTYDDCEFTNNKNGILTKPLRKVWDTFQDTNERNTMILDDRSTVFEKVNPRNGVLIPAYDPYASEGINTNVDTRLPEFMMWLSSDQVKYSSDVRVLDKNNIFR
jgi:TFIIF-interacting CTD phosphatase-like protein